MARCCAGLCWAGVMRMVSTGGCSWFKPAGMSCCPALQVAGVQVNCTDVVLTKVPAAKLQRFLYCGNRLAACNGKKVTNR